MRFIAAIPNYNNRDTLKNLVEQVLKAGFEKVYVMDDASTDDSLNTIKDLHDRVEVVRGAKNIGPGGNRNRIIKYLRPYDVVCFIDADMELMTKDFIPQVKSIFDEEKTVGAIGGLILTMDDKPMLFNYGRYSGAFGFVLGQIFDKLSLVLVPLRGLLTRIADPFTLNLAIRYENPTRREVDWTSEAIFFIKGDVFHEIGGFNSELQYHEGIDLHKRLYRAGYRTIFWPDIHTRHLEGKSRNSRRDSISNVPRLLKQK